MVTILVYVGIPDGLKEALMTNVARVREYTSTWPTTHSPTRPHTPTHTHTHTGLAHHVDWLPTLASAAGIGSCF